MDLGVWMSRGVLAHKRDPEVKLQAWNLRELPDELSRSLPPHRLFIARDGYWRGYFVMEPWVTRNPADKAKPTRSHRGLRIRTPKLLSRIT